MTPKPRICSLLPSATEIICALGLRDSLVGISHGCDYPGNVAGLPVVTRSIVPPGLSSREIDELVTAALREGRSLYELHIAKLDLLRPDIIITQELCDVCAVDFATVARSLARLTHSPQLVSLQPSNIADILNDVTRVAQAANCESQADALVKQALATLKRVSKITQKNSPPRVAALEWLDPLFSAGHWVPEQIALAGGSSCLGRVQQPSARLTWDELENADPEVIVVMPCGYNLQQAVSLSAELKTNVRYRALRAVQSGQVWAVDANSYFSRPSLRVVQGVELLAHILHPAENGWEGSPDAFVRIAE